MTTESARTIAGEAIGVRRDKGGIKLDEEQIEALRRILERADEARG